QTVRRDCMDVQLSAAHEREDVLAQPFDHPARPPPALAHEVAELARRIGEGNRRRLEDRPSALADQRPGEDDVLADLVWPASDAAHRLRAIHAERALRDQSSLE